MAVSRTLVITYGDWDSNDSGFQLHDVHTLKNGADGWELSCTVVLTASSVGTLASRAVNFEAAIQKRNKVASAIDGASTLLSKNPGVTAATWTCQSSQAEAQLIGSHRSGLSRCYVVRMFGANAETTDELTAKRSVSYTISTAPEGWRVLTASIEFTPQLNTSNSAEEMSELATVGFDDYVATYQGILGGSWDRVAPKVTQTDPEGRFCVVSSSWREVIYAQSGSGLNDVKLVDPRYDVTTDRKAFTGYLRAAPLVGISVTFSTGVDKDQSTDLEDVIENTIIPYLRSTVSRVLRLDAEPIEVRNLLKGDPVTNRVEGSVEFVAAEVPILSASRQVSDRIGEGVTLLKILNGQDYARAKHLGPKDWTRTVSIVILEVGATASNLDDQVEVQIATEKAAGFDLISRGRDASLTLTEFDAGGASLTVTFGAAVLNFERADVIETEVISASSQERNDG